MLTAKQLKEIKDELNNCNNPVFLYDNDADGLCSFLLLYKYKKEGHGFRHQKNVTNELEAKFIKNLNPDKLFILDIPVNKITDDFLDAFNIPIIHIEHHLTDKALRGVKTFNPAIKNKKDDSPTASICYNAVKDASKENLWLCAVGTISDWHITKDTKEFAKLYPDFLDFKIKDPAKALYETKIGFLCKIINFILKGKSAEARKAIAHLQHIKDMNEILEQTTEYGKEIYKRYEKVNHFYEALYERAITHTTKDKLLFFKYEEEEMSFSSEISNELLYKYPRKIIFIARQTSEDAESILRCSFRSKNANVRKILLKALEGIDGMGGGHAHACGASVKAKDFDRFVEQFRNVI